MDIVEKVSHLTNLTILMDYHARLGGPPNKWILAEFNTLNEELINELRTNTMKQGSGNKSNSGRKIEPRSEAVNPGAVSQIGNHVGTARAAESMNQGRGYKAPSIGSKSYPSGSQGKH